ncbi:hypothetical protein K070079E91_59330 [Eisenbergiella porci]
MRGIRAGAGQTAGLVPFMRLEKKYGVQVYGSVINSIYQYYISSRAGGPGFGCFFCGKGVEAQTAEPGNGRYGRA